MPRTAYEETVFVLAPTGRDGRLIADTLEKAGVVVDSRQASSHLFEALKAGAAAAIISEEALSGEDLQSLKEVLKEQPSWSDLPILLLTFGGRPSSFNVAAARSMDALGNVTLLERPIRPETLRLAVRAALRARMRQYQLRTRQETLQQAIGDLEQFAYSASHDLKEPLRNIAIYSELLGEEYGAALDTRGREYCTYVREGAQRMGMLVEDLLKYTRLSGDDDPQEPLLSDAEECVKMAIENLAQTIAGSQAVIEANELPTVRMRSTHLYQVFQNLIGNAIKYRSEGAPHVWIRATADGESWKFAVEDNGIGIGREYHERIFGLFKRLHSTSEYSGTGIGLAICQRIVQRYGGRIWVESEVGKGSTFFFTVKA